MHIAILVHVLYGGQGLIHYYLDLHFCELSILATSILHLLKQIFVTILEDYVHFILFLIMYHLLDFDYEL